MLEHPLAEMWDQIAVSKAFVCIGLAAFYQKEMQFVHVKNKVICIGIFANYIVNSSSNLLILIGYLYPWAALLRASVTS
ncbi:uncharacterized protein EV154DRAFT_608137 [Mucor mucedo]|uniref:uncharacterized protein n=1 Tax=Mucor mucedo TaxID=29922 RepID=UPI002220270F|nr:uncharacterized protein EV154DRAFT_608137 [Mucor mucedo]KAI7866098.1 hypothetical protein EV154DRAFT_608137 [Mucor mucedo]